MCIPFLYLVPYALVFSRAAVTTYQKRDGLKQQICILSHFWRPDVEIEVSAGLRSSRGSRAGPSRLSQLPELLGVPWLVAAFIALISASSSQGLLSPCVFSSVSYQMVWNDLIWDPELNDIYKDPFPNKVPFTGSGRGQIFWALFNRFTIVSAIGPQPSGLSFLYPFFHLLSSLCWLRERVLGI